MVEVDAVVQEAEREQERKQLEEIERCLILLQKLQSVFLSSNGALFKQEEITQASGRRCILRISGLKYHKYEQYFEVTQTGVKVVTPYTNPNTYIAAPIDSVLRVLQGVLNGDTSSFSSEWARGQAKIVGSKHLHDGFVFGEVFRRLATLIGRYKGR